MPSSEKEQLYAEAIREVRATCEDEPDEIARMASVVAVLKSKLPWFFWVGFYRRDGDGLVIVPYQGSPACLRIAPGRGVCGVAFAQGRSLVVPDVHDFPGHIACDARSRSEIVVPVRDRTGQILAVLDVDSDQIAAFDSLDREWLERLLDGLF